MVSISSLAIAARWPPHSLASISTSLLMTSSFFCTSPWTFSLPALPSTSPSAPLLTAMAMRLQARATTSISSRSCAGMRPCSRCCSTRYWVRLMRLAGFMRSPMRATDDLAHVVAQVGLGGDAGDGLARRAAVGFGQRGPAVHRARQTAGELRVDARRARSAGRPTAHSRRHRGGGRPPGCRAHSVDSRLRARFGLRSEKSACLQQGRARAKPLPAAVARAARARAPAARTTCRAPARRPGQRVEALQRRVGQRRVRVDQRRERAQAVGHVAGVLDALVGLAGPDRVAAAHGVQAQHLPAPGWPARAGRPVPASGCSRRSPGALEGPGPVVVQPLGQLRAPLLAHRVDALRVDRRELLGDIGLARRASAPAP